jgi:hypothetical protein
MTGTWNGAQGWTPETVQTDTIPVVKRRRTRASAKKAGATFEREVADFLAAMLNDDRIDRRVKTGRNDRGDIGGVRTVRGARVTIEAKNVVRIDLAGWMTEAEVEAGNDDSQYPVVVFKRHGKGDPADQWVLMTLDTFARLVEGGPDEARFE